MDLIEERKLVLKKNELIEKQNRFIDEINVSLVSNLNRIIYKQDNIVLDNVDDGTVATLSFKQQFFKYLNRFLNSFRMLISLFRNN